jgi:hypothetical protein
MSYGGVVHRHTLCGSYTRLMSQSNHRRRVEMATWPWPPICSTPSHTTSRKRKAMFEKVRELFNDEALEQLGKELQMAKGKQHREAE